MTNSQVALPLEEPINCCRCGARPAVRTCEHGLVHIECGDAKHFHAVASSEKDAAIRDWNALFQNSVRA